MGIEMNRQNIYWGRKGLRCYFLILSPAPHFQEEEGFLSLFSLDTKCHSIGA